ncbi:MAG TPA: Spy/CpxP family protein refolding chaperone [Pyrinomonadaceae bacterium]|nr:Spy/CpxP family protein refolding chaperone [Pyrinomonadaceae bacterium]
MKKFANFKMLALVSLSSIVLVASVAFAQTAGTTQGDQNKARGEWRGRGRGEGRDGDHRGGFMGGGMFEKLNLTDDQKARMKTIRESFGERTKSLRDQLEAKRQELRQANQGDTFNEALATQKLTESAGLQAKLMGEEFRLRQEMLTVLTPEQKTQLDQLRQQFKSEHGDFKGRRGERREAPKQ